MVVEQKLDHEWLELMKQAKELGLTVDEVREFLLLQKRTSEILDVQRIFDKEG